MYMFSEREEAGKEGKLMMVREQGREEVKKGGIRGPGSRKGGGEGSHACNCRR